MNKLSNGIRVGRIVLIASLIMCHSSIFAGEQATEDGILFIRNGATPSGGSEILKLKELWRVGGDDEDILFGLIGRVISDSLGNIYLLDTQLSEVQVLSPSGELLRTLSREGDGPGETRRPTGLLLLPEEKVGLVQSFPGKVVLVTNEGDPAGTLTLGGEAATGGFSILTSAKARGGNLVFGGTDVSQGDSPQVQARTLFLASYDMSGTRIATYLTHDYTFDFSNFSFSESKHVDWPNRRFDVGPDGRVFVAADRDLYRISVYNPDGSLDRLIEREYQIEKRSSEEVQQLHDLFRAAMRQIPFEFDIDIEENEPPIQWVQNGVNVREDGSLWVLTSRSVRNQPDGIMQTYDVFDTEGHFTKQVSISCEGNGERDYLFFTGPDRAILVRGFVDAIMALLGGGISTDEEAEPTSMEVICYQINSRG